MKQTLQKYLQNLKGLDRHHDAIATTITSREVQ